MSDADRGVRGVYVLAALATGTVGVSADVFRLDVDVDGIVDFGSNENAGKGSVASLCLVEGRDAHEGVDAGFSGKLPKGILAGHGEGGRLEARLFAVLVIVDFSFKAMTFRPAQIHAQKHIRPIL